MCSSQGMSFVAIDLFVEKVILKNLALTVFLAVLTAAVVGLGSLIYQRMDNLVGCDVGQVSCDVS